MIPLMGRRPKTPLEILRSTELLDPVWYRESHADLRGKPLDAARHYLDHGAREGRNPGPSFDTKWYLQQNPDVVASGMNPLVHYILHGRKEGRLPHSPDFSAEIAGSYRPAPTMDLEGTTVSEPAIKPPPLIAGTELSASEIRRRNAQIDAAVRNLQSKNNRGDNGSVAARGIGLDMTPKRIIAEDNLPKYDVPILRRYNAGRLEAAKRFELDPASAGSITAGPTISLLVPVYRTPVVFLERAILSVLFQTYANWELILVDDFSQRPDVEATLKYYGSVDPRIKVRFRSWNGGISAASNDALAAATGAYVGLLDHDDMLTRDALEQVAERLNKNSDLDFVYTDECKIDRDNVPDDLFHKPDWSPLLLLNFMYTGHFSVYRKSLVESVGGFRSKYDFSQDYDLALRVAERQPKVSHIDECLYGWRMIPGSGASGDRPDARISNIAALQDAAARRGYDGVAIALPTANRVKRTLPAERPLVSIVIPSDNYANIRTSVESIASNSSYANYEILVVTNSNLIASAGNQFGSATRLVSYDKPYNFSDKCNAGAAQAKGDYVIFFNDDVRVITPDWIESLLECLTLPQVGAVSPKLVYENGTIQYAGMVTGVRRLIGTAFHTFPENTTAYFNLAQSVREVSLLTGACLAMPMQVFREVGGFDKDNAPVAHSDVDLCFRVRETGRSCVYTPHAQLTHVGHLSIGSAEAEDRKKAKPFQKNKADLFLLKEWGRYLEEDPYFPRGLRDLVYIDSQEPFSFRKGAGCPRSKRGKDFILFSHDLSASGAPRVLHDIAKLLIDAGHYVLVVSPTDGALARNFIDIGADIIVDTLALSEKSAIVDLAKNFDIAICNTVACWRIPPQIQGFLPVYLYAHESQLIRHFADKFSAFREGLSAATEVWGAGPLVVSAMQSYCGIKARKVEGCVGELKEMPIYASNREDRIIAVIGSYEPRKGQDLAILGFKMLTPEIRAKTKLVMAGRTLDHEYKKEIVKIADNDPAIVFNQELTHADATALAKRADIILVPSRDDPLPLVSMEALASGKILVCSKTTGTSAYIVDADSGFVVGEPSPENICGTLERVFRKKADWWHIGINARRVYETNFTPRLFEERIFGALGMIPRA